MSLIVTDDIRGKADAPNKNGSAHGLVGLESPAKSWYLAVKAPVDFLLGLLLLALTAPLFVLAIVLIRLTSRGPAIYSQTRTGKLGKPFIIYKLRTMVHDCESLTGPRWSTRNDPRVTPLGRWLRVIHIDELPQLWNVLKGEMSLIGPRPERPEFLAPLEQAIPQYRDRLFIKPGVTGLAQIQLPPDTNLASVRLKLAYDLYYLRHCNWRLDVRIVLGTIAKMAGCSFGIVRRLLGLPKSKEVQDH